jgi:hypothetical protein
MVSSINRVGFSSHTQVFSDHTTMPKDSNRNGRMKFVVLATMLAAAVPAQTPYGWGSQLTPAERAKLNDQIAIAQAAVTRLAAGSPEQLEAQAAIDALKQAKEPTPLPPGVSGPAAPPRVQTPPDSTGMNNAPCGATSTETVNPDGSGNSTAAVGVGNEAVFLSKANFTCDPALAAGIAAHEGQRLTNTGPTAPNGTPPGPVEKKNNLKCFKLNKVVVVHALSMLPAGDPRRAVLQARITDFLDPLIQRYS